MWLQHVRCAGRWPWRAHGERAGIPTLSFAWICPPESQQIQVTNAATLSLLLFGCGRDDSELRWAVSTPWHLHMPGISSFLLKALPETADKPKSRTRNCKTQALFSHQAASAPHTFYGGIIPVPPPVKAQGLQLSAYCQSWGSSWYI